MTVNELTNMMMNLNRDFHRARVLTTSNETAIAFGLLKLTNHPGCWVSPNHNPRDPNFTVWIEVA